ncbi:MAG: hypothetical protein GKS01_02110 [Alphaproteobacteria bacterium]|nr:hypothetical protein [Alphaproteobacteria bacterium]
MLMRAAVLGVMGLSVVVGQTIFDKPVASQTADECSNELKQVFKHTKWLLTTDFSSGASELKVTMGVAADGAITIKNRRRGPFTIKCSGKNISFDWKNDDSKRYTLTMEKDGNFDGSRTGSSDDYGATLKKR